MAAVEAQQEIWTPQEDEWYEATVIDRDLRKRLLILTLSNGEKVSCFSSRISKGIGGHVLCAANVPIGAPCAVRMERNIRDYSYYFALESCFDSSAPIPKTIEPVVVHSWNEGKTYGTGIRPCGCSLFTSTSWRSGSFEMLKEGDEVLCEIVPSVRKRGLAAAYVLNQDTA